MSDALTLALIVLALPLAAAVVRAIFSKTSLRTRAHWPLLRSLRYGRRSWRS